MRAGFGWLTLCVATLAAVTVAAATAAVATVGKVTVERADLETVMEDLAGTKVLLRLMDEKLIQSAGQSSGLLVSEEEAVAELSRVARAFPDPAAFQAALSGAGLDRSALVRRIRADLTLENLGLQSFNPPEEELVQHYAKYRDAFGEPTVVRARHMAVTQEAEALELRAQLDEGADFAALARTRSVDGATRERGGDMGELSFFRPYARGMVSLTGELFPLNVNGLDVMGPTTDRLQLWQLARSARESGLIGPVKTTFGWSLVQLLEWREGSAPPYNSIRPVVLSHLFRMRYPLRLDVLRWELRQRANIKIHRPRYQELEKPAAALRWSVDPALIDPLHPSLLNLRVFGLQDVLRLYVIGDLMQDFDALRLTTKNHAYATRMAAAGSVNLRMNRAVEELILTGEGDDGWTKIRAKARLRYREGKTTWTATQQLTADVLSSPDGYRWKIVDATPPIRVTESGGEP